MSPNDPNNTRKAPDDFTLGPPTVTGSYLTVRTTQSGEWELSPFVAQWTARAGVSWYRHDTMNLEDKRYASWPRQDKYTSACIPWLDTTVAHMQIHEMNDLQRRRVLDGMTIEQIEAYLEQRRAGR